MYYRSQFTKTTSIAYFSFIDLPIIKFKYIHAMQRRCMDGYKERSNSSTVFTCLRYSTEDYVLEGCVGLVADVFVKLDEIASETSQGAGR